MPTSKTSAKILYGKEAGAVVEETLKKRIQILQKGGMGRLKLTSIQIGESKDVELYSACIARVFERFQMEYAPHKFSLPREAALNEPGFRKEYFQKIYETWRHPSVTGVLIFSPVPSYIAQTIFYHLPASKDIEGRTYMKKASLGVFAPTANAVMTILNHAQVNLKGAKAVVVGHSYSVGQPIALALLDKDATVTVCHKESQNIAEEIQKADVVVAAVGKARLIRGEWIKPGAVVIDVGENIVEGKVVGDVDFEAVAQKASMITPVPGGIGPLTGLMLMRNLITLYEDEKTHAHL